MTKFIYAVDFDGTLVENKHPKIGRIKKNTVNYIKQLKKEQNYIILWTCRHGKYLKNALKWCNKHKIFFDAINNNLNITIKKYKHNSRKIYADYYIDDKNLIMKG